MREALSGGVLFSAGEEFGSQRQRDADISLEEVLSGAGLFEAMCESLGEEAPPDEWAAGGDEDDMGRIGARVISHINPPEAARDMFGSGERVTDYFPYPNKGMLKTDILFSAPELRFSRRQKEAVLAWGKELGAREVPSLYRLENFQKDALEACGNPTKRVQTRAGNIFYHNSVQQSIARDYAHPDIRPLIKAYPVFSGNRVTEHYQGSKWLVDAPDELLTPMIRLHDRDFYVNELTYCEGGQWFIPKRFFEFEGHGMWAVGHNVAATPDGLVVSDTRSMRACCEFRNNWPEVEAWNTGKTIFAPVSASYASKMPNPDRITAGGLEWECPPLIIFIDDVSGNSSKQWNVHYSCYMSNGGLPRAEIEKTKHIRFVATSPHASPMEIVQAVCEDIRRSGGTTPIKAWDAVRKRYVLLRLWLLFLPGDNPMQAELCSHIGLNGNFFCRCCHAGGDKEFKESNSGFPSLLRPGRPRTVSETRNTVMDHLIAATHAAAEKPLRDAITKSGIKDSLSMPIINRLVALGKVFRRSTPDRKAMTPEQVNQKLHAELLKNPEGMAMNPLLNMEGLDVHQDTPVEPLHTHLLGVVKYFWAQTTWVLEKSGHFATFQARLNSLSKFGLKVPNIMADYMCRYRGSLIGKHFKTISQIMSFAVCGLVEENLQNAWLAIGYLTVLLWETEIDDINSYVKTLRKAIDDVIDFAAQLSPSLITDKNKFHILSHLPDHVLRHGPALLFSTERYESFNHIFRLCSIHSNRQAPSRDIAVTFANQDRCRHMVSGGFWLDSRTNTWVNAAPAVRAHLENNILDARLLGLAPASSEPSPGKVTLSKVAGKTGRTLRQPPPNQVSTCDWVQTKTHEHLPNLVARSDGPWSKAQSVIAGNGDNVSVGTEVLVLLGEIVDSATPLVFCSVVELLQPAQQSDKQSIITVRRSVLSAELHTHLRMPVLSRTGSFHVLEPQELLCAINVQHNCSSSTCTASGTQVVRQERESTSQSRTVLLHSNSPLYVVNMHALHNQHLLARALPESLRTPASYFTDRTALHTAAAESLRDGKLRKKIAKEAAVRKSAEEALRRMNTPASLNLIGIGETSPPTADSEAQDNERQNTLVDLEPSRIVDNSVSVQASGVKLHESAPAAPRGPRQRRPKTQTSSRTNDQGASTSRGQGASRGRRAGPTRGREAAHDRAAIGNQPAPSVGEDPGEGGGMVGEQSVDAALALVQGHSSIMDHQVPTAARDSQPLAASDDDGELLDPLLQATFPRTALTAQLLRNSAEEKCESENLNARQTEEVLAFCMLSPVEMLVDLKIHLFKIETDLLRRYFRLYIRHPDFALRLRNCVGAVILAHNVPAYLQNVTNSIAEYLEKHLDTVALTQQCRDDAADWAIVKTAIADMLTQVRSGLKSKLELDGLKKGEDIYELTKSVMGYDVRPRKEHWGRLAFLRHCAQQHKTTLPKGPDGKIIGFWAYVDNMLKDVRASIKNKHPIDTIARKREEANFFATILQLDVSKYPIKSGGVAQTVYNTPDIPNLQYAMERAVVSFVVDDTERPDIIRNIAGAGGGAAGSEDGEDILMS
ncbi:hypothetical protein C8Q79DRAFT_912903 [Trametes meyenii]|nr:hypothetical protein C8Q79DRAFT_912903 [Trametes meyenii]